MEVKRKKLVVIAISGNEEKWVKQWCESVLKAKPDLVIVNLTQYGDNTEDLLKQYIPEDKLLFMKHPWKKSFSEARNHTVEAVPDWADYVLFIDMDEVITEESYQLLDSFLSQDFPPNIIMWNIYNQMVQSGMQASLFYPRMWPHKNRAGEIYKYKFEADVHNQLVFEDKNIEALRTPLSLYHFGYALSDEEMQKKHQRSEELLRGQIEKDPQDYFSHANLAQLLRAKGDHKGTEYHAREAIRLVSSGIETNAKRAKDMLIMTREQLTTALMSQNRWDEAREVAEQVIKDKADHLDSIFNLGNIYMNLGNIDQAKFWFNRYLFIRQNYDENRDDTNIILNHLTSSFLAIYNLGLIALGEKKFAIAADHFMKSFKEQPTFSDALCKYLHTIYFMDYNRFNKEANSIIKSNPDMAHLIYDLFTTIAVDDVNLEQAKFFAYQAANINIKSPENAKFKKRHESLIDAFGEVSNRYFNTKNVNEQSKQTMRV